MAHAMASMSVVHARRTDQRVLFDSAKGFSILQARRLCATGHYNATPMTVEKFPRAILLAAGAASRFGGGKLMHPLADGIAISVHAMRNLKAAGVDVTAVVRRGDDALAAMLTREGALVVVCDKAEEGMGASLACGVAAAPSDSGWIIALADMPSVRAATISLVGNALRQGAAIAAPTFEGQRGHPVGFAARYGDELRALGGDEGARSLVQRDRKSVILVATDDPGVLLDVDRREDLPRTV